MGVSGGLQTSCSRWQGFIVMVLCPALPVAKYFGVLGITPGLRHFRLLTFPTKPRAEAESVSTRSLRAGLLCALP